MSYFLAPTDYKAYVLLPATVGLQSMCHTSGDFLQKNNISLVCIAFDFFLQYVKIVIIRTPYFEFCMLSKLWGIADVLAY